MSMSFRKVTLRALEQERVCTLERCCVDVIVGNIGNFLGELNNRDIYLPESSRESILTKLSKKDFIHKHVIDNLICDGISTLNLTGADLSRCTPDVLESIWTAAYGISSVILDDASISICIMRMLTYIDIYKPQNSMSLLNFHARNTEIMTDTIVEILTTNCPNIRSLVIPMCPLLTEYSFEVIANGVFASSLEYLDYSYNKISYNTLKNISSSFCEMKKLNLAGSITESPDKNTILGLSIRFPLPHLIIHLDISSCMISSNDIVFILKPIIHQIITLSIAESVFASDDLLELLHSLDTTISCTPFHCPLTSLNISWCDNLEDYAVSQWLGKCPKLTTLSNKCGNIGSHSLRALVKSSRCPMTELILPRCENIDSTHLNDYICSMSATLQHLDISWGSVTDSGVLAILNNCIVLKILILEGCKDLTALVFDTLMKSTQSCSSYQSVDGILDDPIISDLQDRQHYLNTHLCQDNDSDTTSSGHG